MPDYEDYTIDGDSYQGNGNGYHSNGYDQMADLNRLKEWIYKKRTQIRLECDRAERRQKREQEAARRKAEQPALFQF